MTITLTILVVTNLITLSLWLQLIKVEKEADSQTMEHLRLISRLQEALLSQRKQGAATSKCQAQAWQPLMLQESRGYYFMIPPEVRKRLQESLEDVKRMSSLNTGLLAPTKPLQEKPRLSLVKELDGDDV